MYHLLLGLITIGVSSGADWRAHIQDGFWPIKFLALVGITVGAFFIPNSFFVVYGWIMVIGAAFFILIQLMLLIEFAYSWNESWLLKMEDEEMEGGSTWYYMLLGSTVLMLCSAIAFTGVMYAFFCKSGCSLNSFYVTMNLLVGLILCVLSLHPKVREGRPSSGLLQSAVVMLYSTYLVYSAIMSEPQDKCSPFNWSDKTKATSLIMGATFTIVGVVYSTVRTASSSEELLGGSSGGGDIEKAPLVSGASEGADADHEVEDDEAGSTSYSYTHFHISFALGAMYICMLLTNWMTLSKNPEDPIVDRGEISVWAKIISSWLTLLLYGWTLLAPAIFPDREWN